MSGKKNKQELPKWYDGAKYTEGDLVTNPFSGEQAKLTANELAMYDLIMGAQLVQDWKLTQKVLTGLDQPTLEHT
jgi:hypothetical protein